MSTKSMGRKSGRVQEDSISRAVVKIVEKGGFVRNTVEKEMYGCVPNQGYKDTVKEVEEGKQLKDEIEEVVRIGKYTKGGQRAIKIQVYITNNNQSNLGEVMEIIK